MGLEPPRKRMRDAFLVRVNGSGARPVIPEEVAIIKGMLARHDNQHDIAAYFGTNGGRIAEVNRGYRFPDVAAAPPELLPPPGVQSLKSVKPVVPHKVHLHLDDSGFRTLVSGGMVRIDIAGTTFEISLGNLSLTKMLLALADASDPTSLFERAACAPPKR